MTENHRVATRLAYQTRMECNPAKRLLKAPKVFLPDSGLLGQLTGYTAHILDAASGLPGRLVETFVADDLLKHLVFSRRGHSLGH